MTFLKNCILASAILLIAVPHSARAFCRPEGIALDVKSGTSLDAIASAVQEATGCNLVFTHELDTAVTDKPLTGDNLEKILQLLAKSLHAKSIQSGPTFVLAPDRRKISPLPGTGRFVSVDFHQAPASSVNTVLAQLGVKELLEAGGTVTAKLLDVPQDDLPILLKMRRQE